MLHEQYLEHLNQCAKNFQEALDSSDPLTQKVVEKGLLLYRQNYVSQVKIDHETVTGVIQDVNSAKAVLHIDDISMSSCTCFAEGYCRHQLALFFSVLGAAGKVSAWLSEWRQPPQKAAVDLSSLPLMRASDLLKKPGNKEPDYEEWVDFFTETFQSVIGESSRKPSAISEMYYIYMRKLKNSSPQQNEWKYLYLLVGHVITFKLFLSMSKENNHADGVINRYYRHIFQDLLQGVQEYLNRLSNFTFPFAFDLFLEKLKDDSGEILHLHKTIEFESIQIYRILWTNLFTKKQWRLDELKKLTSIESPVFTEKVAATHLQVLLREDEKAVHSIQELQVEIMPYMLYWLDILNSKRDWNRLELYLTPFIQSLKAYIQQENDFEFCHEFTSMSIRAATPFCHAKNRMDILERLFNQTLPYSYRKYEDFLYEQKQFDKWIDLYTYMGLGIDMLTKEQIKTLQEYDQALLLSLYHRSVQEHIDQKSRDHYRIAVRQMKKLRTIYKKLKKQQQFELFLKMTLDRTKRLRAFHEECRKGKLIHAEE
ncbi:MULTISPECIES: SWIM zinc finger family protein [unclassified Niallia]|uniref:SWIM zinc finger family protein n=1 Tax=unclassified Niallia TaxID=2837522 RepID=UPI001EDC8F8B|nr:MULTISPECIES: SWIM zinc finger family protein [unclassified Niallia]MCM3031837.1 SWIM zinc finger family protein [Niallia sp. MER 6]MDL0436960.1 SWIM zinc finger family protein [Niallia sp. SS-2023]UPO87437.1 SWIM zinc finger family protein [Niallia sp. Man26]